jgi:hypothetical protein
MNEDSALSEERMVSLIPNQLLHGLIRECPNRRAYNHSGIRDEGVVSATDFGDRF